MAKIIINGNQTKLTEETDVEHILALGKHLSFFVKGSEHTAAFKGYLNRDGDWVKWDGIKKLLNPNMTFPTGLVERVKEFYKLNGRPLEVVDARPAKSSGKPFDILPTLAAMDKSPYPYQLDVLPIIDQFDRGIIKVATGGGKSLIAALIAAKLGKKTIIYVIGKDLLYQFHAFFEQTFDRKIGLIGDGNCDIREINIASIWTVGQAIGMGKQEILLDSEDTEKAPEKSKYDDILKLVKAAKVHIIDECHMAACETIQKLYRNTHVEHIYGLSGSPWRDDGQDLLIESILGQYIVNISASYLIERGYLAQPLIKFRVVPPYPNKLERQYQSVYKKYVVENDIRNQLVLQAAKAMVDKGYQTLVLFSSLKHGKILHELFSEKMQCAILDGSNDNDERQAVKNDLMAGKINCVLASRIFDIGVDIPSLSGLVIACGGKSTVKALQRIGRVIRKYPGKKFSAIADFYDQAPFLTEHSEVRRTIYESEEGFQVTWPKIIKM